MDVQGDTSQTHRALPMVMCARGSLECKHLMSLGGEVMKLKKNTGNNAAESLESTLCVESTMGVTSNSCTSGRGRENRGWGLLWSEDEEERVLSIVLFFVCHSAALFTLALRAGALLAPC